MPRRRFQPEEIIQKLREVEALLTQGKRNCSRACVALTCFTRFSAIAPLNVCQSVDGF